MLHSRPLFFFGQGGRGSVGIGIHQFLALEIGEDSLTILAPIAEAKSPLGNSSNPTERSALLYFLFSSVSVGPRSRSLVLSSSFAAVTRIFCLLLSPLPPSPLAHDDDDDVSRLVSPPLPPRRKKRRYPHPTHTLSIFSPPLPRPSPRVAGEGKRDQVPTTFPLILLPSCVSPQRTVYYCSRRGMMNRSATEKGGKRGK